MRICQLAVTIKTPPLSCVTAPLNPVATSGPAGLLSTSIEGVSATTTASGPSIVQLTVHGRSPDHEQGRVNSLTRFVSQRTTRIRTVRRMTALFGSTSPKNTDEGQGISRLCLSWPRSFVSSSPKHSWPKIADKNRRNGPWIIRRQGLDGHARMLTPKL
jgi:hypothetical protein